MTQRQTPDPFRSIRFPPELPISQRKEEIVSAIQSHQVIVLSGETGSGKTTQIPKMCIAAGLGQSGGKIACTQPRRVAALSVAKRVAEELEVEFGREVGAKIRFTDQTSKNTRVKFMTDGMLLSEIHGDPLMREYDAVILDEAHERSLNIDFLMGYLNRLRAKRPELKIIITSATIDTQKFSQAFDDAPIIEVSGRVYPVETIYAPLDELLEEQGDFTFIEGISESVDRIQKELGLGDILVFLPTEKDIHEAMDVLDGRYGRRMEVVPCFGRLSNADQQRIFKTTAKRKLVLATNIAETSLTIPGIRFVIDTGLARISRYNARARTKRLPVVKVSQASANQRKGRCGRVADGVCIRLYSESDFESREVYSVPEIQRSNLADVILRMMANDLGHIETFPFIDPPSDSAIKAGYQLLEELGAIKTAARGYRLTPLGRQLARLPVDPTVGRMLLEAQKRDVVEEVLVIASALSIQDPRERPLGKESAARQAHATFLHRSSDFLTLLNIWDSLHDDIERLSQGKLRKFCKRHFLNYLRMREWRDVYEQLKRSLPKPKPRSPDSPKSKAPKQTQKKTRPSQDDLERNGARYAAIHTCLLTGLLANPGRREEQNLYRCSGNRKPLIFPGSGLFIKQPFDKRGKRKAVGTEAGPRKKSPEWILAGEIVETNRLYARTVAAIDADWILQVGEHILKRSYSEPQFEPGEGRVTARESTRIHGLEIQTKKVSYLKVDPAKATEIFIREALLNEDFDAPHNWDFLETNRKLIRRIQNAQTVTSVAHWMGVEEAAFQFYEKRLRSIASIHDLNRFLKRRGDKNADDPVAALILSESDLTASQEASVDLSQFPEAIELENSALPIEYQYKHGDKKDGVTLKVPYHQTQSLNNAMLDWLVPGHLETKIHALLKALPKATRQRLIPLAETAKSIAQSIRPTGDSLVASLAQHLEDSYSIETYASDWDESAIPDHLRVRVEVHDKEGKPVAEGRDLETIHQQIKEREAQASKAKAPDTSAMWQKARSQHERPIEGLSALPADLPDKIKIGEASGLPVHAYPALREIDRSGAHPEIQLCLFKTPQDAKASNRNGIAALIEYECRRELAWVQADIKEVERVGAVAVPFRPIAKLKEDVYQHIRQNLRSHDFDTIEISDLEKAIQRAKTKSKGLLYATVDRLKEILEQRHKLIVNQEVMARFASDLERLLPPDFLRHTPSDTLPRIPVYLRCLERRLRNLQKNPQRESQRQQEFAQYLNRYNQLLKSKPSMTTEQTNHLRWMMEEFAISLFAQDLGTAYPVSAKKLDQAFDEAGSSPLQVPTNQLPKNAVPDKPSKGKQADRPTKADLDSLKNLFG